MRMELRVGVAVSFGAAMCCLMLALVGRVNALPDHEDPEPPRAREPIEVVDPVRPRPLANLRAALEPLIQPQSPSLPAPLVEPAGLPAVSANVKTGVIAFGPRGLGLTGVGKKGQAPPSLAVKAVDRPARARQRPAPRYPVLARRRGIEGFVLLRLSVDAGGRVTDVAVVDSEPPSVFDEAAKGAARRYRFEPAQKQGKAVSSVLEQKVVFRLQ